jgi:hypothetical protein
LEDFRAQTRRVIGEPFLLCLAEALAVVESAGGRRAIVGGAGGEVGINEIGYKAVPGKPSFVLATREADADGVLRPARAAFRLFADRAEQARALLWLMRSSAYYEAARLLYALAFVAAYAPGRDDGALELLRVFNALARTGAHRGVRPFALTEGSPGEADALNHAAARRAVRLFAELTAHRRIESKGEGTHDDP